MTKAKEITNDIRDNISTQKILFRVLIICSAILCAVYMYMIVSITFNIIARKSLETTITTLTSRVNQLEITYLSNINKADKNYAQSQGFVDARNNIFASRDVNYVAIR